MELLKDYRDSRLAREILEEIKKLSKKRVKIMEICGTHTAAIFRHGIRDVLPENITLISGPGCPVCVTPNRHIDEALEIATRPEVILTSFGDMIKVPGTRSSINREKALGADIRIVYSTMESLELARMNPDKEIVFFGIGFETTAPTVAVAVQQAHREGTRNFSVVGAHKLVPEAIRALITNDKVGINGFICPGHVSTLIGVKPFQFIADEFGIPAVITGFEPVDLIQGIYMLVKQIENRSAAVEIQYNRGVPPEGNPHAMDILFSVFETTDAVWRGIGCIQGTGLNLKEKFSSFDAVKKFGIKISDDREDTGCDCGDILRGVKTPPECGLYGKRCVPENPVGPCMVSLEGTCSIYYKYGKRSEEFVGR